MSEGSISQAEIDALLSGVDMGGLGTGASPAVASSGSKFDVETLKKFADGIKDKLGSQLNAMTGAEVSVDAPVVETLNRDQLLAKIPEVVVAVMADYSTALSGDHLFIMDPECAKKIVSLVNKEESPELDDMALSVISEVVAQHSGAEITDLSKDGKLPGLATNAPEAINQPKAMVRMPQDTFALFTYPLNIDGTPYTLWEAVSGPVADGMVKALGGGEPAPAPQQATGAAQQFNQQPMMGVGMSMGGMSQVANTPNVQSLQFPNLQQVGGTPEQGNIGLIMDVFMEMTVELGRTKKTIKDILGMGEGTIIELDKLAGEPVDILVNHKPIAKGEVVVIDENFGVRVTEILPAIEHVTAQM